MSEIKYIPFEEESDDIKDRVTGYWTERAESFFEQRQHELKSPKAGKWLGEIKLKMDEVFGAGNKEIKILDVGCGAGYFSVLLGKEGYEVTGIDLTLKMIDEANRLIEMNGPFSRKVSALKMDAENPEFPDESFDMVITRNLTWTLPHPVEAYREWKRVLKKGGLLLNFDAEYAKGAHNLKTMENLAHRNISDKLKDECHEIYHMLTISALDRPEWDREILERLGYADVMTDIDFADRIFSEKDEFYIPDRMFMISARKI
ncbi:class I SAM-dependent methyltransferase [Butyrivibrio sp. AE3004]|uniref:class I SAM-dependent methyltransferase n=1 Tax=Butyrivibrio sp. AE3004 TaxID=1506994 RepID=UPI000493EA2E|nr:class I SAM-dependent methyltransferase [Butyrivibrio sp. AE3004]